MIKINGVIFKIAGLNPLQIGSEVKRGILVKPRAVFDGLNPLQIGSEVKHMTVKAYVHASRLDVSIPFRSGQR